MVTPLILGSMSVGLNILIHHSFMDFISLDYGLDTMTTTTYSTLKVFFKNTFNGLLNVSGFLSLLVVPNTGAAP